MIKVYSFFLFLSIFFYGCLPKAHLGNVSTLKSYSPIHYEESFIVLENGSDLNVKKEFIADIKVLDRGFSGVCDYENTIRVGTYKAKEFGANLLIVDKHKKPDVWSSCHRIHGKIYHIEDADSFVNVIRWSETNKLKIRNFKGSKENRPAQAATFTQINYYYLFHPKTRKRTIIVESLFYCDYSYFIKSDSDSSTLRHEQLHFDICELYARKLRKRAGQELKGVNDFLNNCKPIYDEIHKELLLRQDEYDSQASHNPLELIKWEIRIKQELNDLKSYALPEMRFTK